MRRKNILKLTAATFAVIGAGNILFNTAAETVMAAKAGQVERVSTSYQISGYQASGSPAASLSETETKEEGSERVNYHVSMDSQNTGTPAETDLTMEEAAETGAQYLRDIFGLDLEGAYVCMRYNPGTGTFPRAFWAGSVLFEEEQTPESTKWTYMIDAVTGELFNMGHDRYLDVNPSLNPDAALAKDYSVYAELARTRIEECRLMDSLIDRVEYNCQGYSGNDPTITVDVIGEKGEIVTMSFSRYDQAFLGLGTDISRRISEAALDDFVGEVESMTFSAQY